MEKCMDEMCMDALNDEKIEFNLARVSVEPSQVWELHMDTESRSISKPEMLTHWQAAHDLFY